MTEDPDAVRTGGGWKVAAGVGTILLTLSVTFISPLVKKKGEQLAGVPSQDRASKPAVVVVQAPIVGDPIVARSPDSPGSSGGGAVPMVVVQSPVAAAGEEVQPVKHPRREPRVIRNEITVPRFESTEQVDYFESSGTGSSAERETAIFKALDEALSKQGCQLNTEVRLKLMAETKRLNDSKVRRVEQSVASDFSRVSGELLRWWDIRSEADDGEKCTVQVLAVVAKIKAQAGASSTRKTLAVLPFKLDGDARLNDRVVPAGTIGSQLREAGVTYLVNSRKFAVLDKTLTEELDRLVGQNPSADPVQRAIDVARKLGAQYAVVGLVDGLSVERRRIGTLDVPSIEGTASLRIIELSSRQTVLASSFPLANLNGLDLSGGRPENSIADALGRAMADRTLETIYPFKVAALNGPDEVVLNRGGDVLSVGERFDLFNPGEEIKDPSTGESLGVAERKIGTVEIARVLPKVSYAKIIAKTEPVLVEAICRKPQKSSDALKDKPTKIRSEIDNLFK